MQTLHLDVARRHLDLLFGALDEGYILIWSGRYQDGQLVEKVSQWAKTVDAAIDIVARMSPERSIYYGLGVQAGPLSGGARGARKDIIGVTGIAVDVDIAGDVHGSKKYPRTREEALAIVRAPTLKPTAIVDTGHGIQAIWALKEPEIFRDDTEKTRWEMRSLGWHRVIAAQAAALGYAIDAVHDLARVLRLPGTWNAKREPAVQATIIESNLSAAYATLADLDCMISDAPRAVVDVKVDVGDVRLDPNAYPPGELKDTLCELSPLFKRTWEGKRSDIRDGSASAYSASLAAQALRAGWCDQDVVDLVIAWRRKNGAPTKVDRPDWYKRHLLEYCKRSIAEEEMRVGADAQAEARRAAEKAGREAAQKELEAKRDEVEKALAAPAADSAQNDHPTATATTDDSKQSDRREAVKKWLRETLGLNVQAVYRVGRHCGTYILCLDRGTGPLGTSEELLRYPSFRAAIVDIAQIVLPARLPEKTWQLAIRGILELCETKNIWAIDHKSAVGTHEDDTTWIDDTLRLAVEIHNDPCMSEVRPRIDCIRQRLGFVAEGRSWMLLSSIRELVRASGNDENDRQVIARLRALNAINKTFGSGDERGKTQANYWGVPRP